MIVHLKQGIFNQMKRLIVLAIIVGIAILHCTSTDAPVMSYSDSDRSNNLKNSPQYEDSPQYRDGKFDDMGNALNMSFTDFVSTTWEFLFSKNKRTPDAELPVRQADLSYFRSGASGQLSVTWLGHSSLMINIDGYKILADPVFEKRVSIFGPTRFNGDLPVDIQQIPNVDAIIISHDHYDHLNKYSVRHLIDKADTFIVPLAVGALLEGWGVPRDRIVELDWWQEHRVDPNLMVAATPALHFSGRGILDRNKTLWASWVIQTPHHNIFFSGDSGYFDGFKKIGDKYGPFDMTFLECGAYGEGWPRVHMFPEQTVQAHLDLKGNVLHPIHWGTFNLALHPWYEPMVRLAAAADEKNIIIATPIVGDTSVFGNSIATTRWWEPAAEHSAGVMRTAVVEKDI
jgi:L-ascorbate metabolism protein UlaG (beta-lactamase superfamily)